jgi:hypothetical protein
MFQVEVFWFVMSYSVVVGYHGTETIPLIKGLHLLKKLLNDCKHMA